MEAKEVAVVDEPELRFRFVGERGPVFAALGKAGLTFKPIVRDRKVKVRPRDTSKAEYEFAYAPLENLVDATRKSLADNELVIMQPFNSTRGGWLVRTILGHSSGAYMEAIDFIQSNERMSNQDFGGILSFRRRYAYGAILGLASEEDDDANAAEGNVAVQVPRQAKGTQQSRPQQSGRGSRKLAVPAKANITPPPNWPDTDVTNLCNWVNNLEPSASVFKAAYGMLRADEKLAESCDWPPVYKAYTNRLRHLVMEKKISRQQLGEEFEDKLIAENERLEAERKENAAEPFGDEPAQVQTTPGTESHEPANQT